MIRTYRDADMKELLDVWYRASLIAHPFLHKDFLEKEMKAIEEVYTPMAETWVYEQAGRVVGFIALIGDEVGAIFVDPQLQGQGIGRALMRQAQQLRDQLEVEVFEANEIGRRFYDRYGFEVIKEHIHQQTGHPLIRMRLTVD